MPPTAKTWTAAKALVEIAGLCVLSRDSRLGRLERIQQVLDGVRLDPKSSWRR